MIPQDPKKLLDRYTSDEICKIFKEECDKAGIRYSHGSEPSVFVPLKREDTELKV